MCLSGRMVCERETGLVFMARAPVIVVQVQQSARCVCVSYVRTVTSELNDLRPRYLACSSQYKLFHRSWLNDIVFTTYSASNPGHLAPWTLGNAGTILFSQTSDMNLINATLLLVHFLIMSRPNIWCVRFMRMRMFMYFMILLSVLVFYFSLFL